MGAALSASPNCLRCFREEARTAPPPPPRSRPPAAKFVGDRRQVSVQPSSTESISSELPQPLANFIPEAQRQIEERLLVPFKVFRPLSYAKSNAVEGATHVVRVRVSTAAKVEPMLIYVCLDGNTAKMIDMRAGTATEKSEEYTTASSLW